MIISSRANQTVKMVRALHQAKARKESGLHFIEGDKLVLEALQSGAQLQTVFGAEDYPPLENVNYVTVTRPVMEALCQTDTPQKLCATVKTPSQHCPDDYSDGLIVVLDGLQDVGNVGTIIRTADALGASAVMLSEDSVDAYSPKCVRASMGSCYHLPIYRGELIGELEKMKSQGVLCLCGHLQGNEQLPKGQPRTALIVGNEGNGVRDSIAQLCYKYKLPQHGKAESLNAAVFSAILMYELLK